MVISFVFKNDRSKPRPASKEHKPSNNNGTLAFEGQMQISDFILKNLLYTANTYISIATETNSFKTKTENLKENVFSLASSFFRHLRIRYDKK